MHKSNREFRKLPRKKHNALGEGAALVEITSWQVGETFGRGGTVLSRVNETDSKRLGNGSYS